ncbi:DUF5652 family protein [Candidatus Parcubacteria bacterium]|nr:DUF5652 family protein [Candidatus Parcubacteria bacterium]
MPASASFDTLNNWVAAHPLLWGAVLIWSLAWKGFALWKAAERDQKYWFIALLILNTLGLLDIFYIYVIARKYKVEVVDDSK